MHRNRYFLFIFLIAVFALGSPGAAHSETAQSEPRQEASLARAMREVASVMITPVEPYFGCEQERVGPDSQLLPFPCKDAGLIRTDDEARAIASYSLSRFLVEKNQAVAKNKWSIGEYLAAGAVAALGEAIDDNPAVDLDPTQDLQAKQRDYALTKRPDTPVKGINRLGLITHQAMKEVGTCSAALQSALTRMEAQGSDAAKRWSREAQAGIGSASYYPKTRCYRPRRCVPEVPDTSHSSNVRYMGRVGHPTMVIKCSVQ